MVQEVVRLELSLGEVCISRTKCRYVPHSPNRKMHWGEKASWTEAWKDAVYYEWRGHPKYLDLSPTMPWDYPRVRITSFTTHPMDRDNLYASMKPVIDGLTVAGIIHDDAETFINLEVTQERVRKKKDQYVLIEIWKQLEPEKSSLQEEQVLSDITLSSISSREPALT